MKKLVASAVVASAVALGAAGSATAAPLSGGKCVQAGLGTLRTLGLFDDAVRKGIDYSTLADPVEGPIFADLPEGSYLSLGQVVKLHTSNPNLFAWCR